MTHYPEYEELYKALNKLFLNLCHAFKIDVLTEWLNEMLTKNEGKQ